MKIMRDLRKSILAWHVGVAFAVQVMGYGVTFILNIWLARWLGVEQYGSFIFFKNAVTILGIFGTLGLFGAAMKYVSAYWASSKIPELRGFIVAASTMTILAALLLILIALFVGIHFPPNDINLTILLPFVAVILLIALHTLYADVLRGMQYIFEAIAPTDLLRPILTLLIVAISIVFFDMQPLQATLVAFVLSIGIVLLYQLAIIARTLYKNQSDNKKPVYHLRDWIEFGLESLFFRGTIILRSELPAILIAYLLVSSDVGLFVVAERAAYLTTFLFEAVRRVFEPMIAPLYEKNDLKALNALHQRITRWTFLASLMISAIILIFSNFLLGLFGEAFIAARPLLIVLLIGQLVNSATGQVGSILRFTKYEKLVRNITAISTLLMLIITVVLTLFFGIMGTALGIALGVILQNLAFYLATQHYLGIRLPLGTYWLFGSTQDNA